MNQAEKKFIVKNKFRLGGIDFLPGTEISGHICPVTGNFSFYLFDKKNYIYEKAISFYLMDARPMDQLFRETIDWQRKTFGSNRGPLPQLHHLEKEIRELKASPSDPQEYADAFILLFGAAAEAGFSYNDILNAISDKLEINKAREWGKPDKNGVVEHRRSRWALLFSTIMPKRKKR